MKNRSEQRVLLIKSGSLLDEGVESLLKDEVDLEVADATASDEATLLEDIARVHPDVILLNEVDPLQATRILELLKSAPTVRVIVTRLSSNTVDVYDKQEVNLTESADLVSLLLGRK